ncbi:hypothetical protein [Peribacillus sp. YIM B13477]|uniref:hypothetical protein n=1 Tax=Peribacillus sp. YIM B13477 TaxID=3366300 RepID=UPI0036705A0C
MNLKFIASYPVLFENAMFPVPTYLCESVKDRQLKSLLYIQVAIILVDSPNY